MIELGYNLPIPGHGSQAKPFGVSTHLLACRARSTLLCKDGRDESDEGHEGDEGWMVGC